MIIKSILDTDLYKFTTSYAYMKLFPQAVGTFEFFDRDNTQYTEEFIEQLRMEISNFCSLRLTHDEQDYMTTHCRFIPSMYWEWLSGVKLNSGLFMVMWVISTQFKTYGRPKFINWQNTYFISMIPK